MAVVVMVLFGAIAAVGGVSDMPFSHLVGAMCGVVGRPWGTTTATAVAVGMCCLFAACTMTTVTVAAIVLLSASVDVVGSDTASPLLRAAFAVGAVIAADPAGGVPMPHRVCGCKPLFCLGCG